MRKQWYVWIGYSTRQAAEFVGLSESAVRSCIRAGVIKADDSRVPTKVSFRDLKVLQKIKSLATAGLSPIRVRRQLTALSQRLPPEGSLAELTIEAYDGNVIVRDNSGDRPLAWRADNGQLLFDFAVTQLPSDDATVLPCITAKPKPEAIDDSTRSATEWFEYGLELEDQDPEAAIKAYQKSLELKPNRSDTLINLGRLYAETGQVEPAMTCFRSALRLEPDDATATYNLGVVTQDAGDDHAAIELYTRALELNAGLCEAHYNLATIYERLGDVQAAIRHINDYRKLTKR